jgi:hypothetical protein
MWLQNCWSDQWDLDLKPSLKLMAAAKKTFSTVFDSKNFFFFVESKKLFRSLVFPYVCLARPPDFKVYLWHRPIDKPGNTKGGF